MKIIEHYTPKPIPPEAQTETISVVVAVYNIEPYLDRAVQSVLDQTYRNLEVILVDDGSTDGCPGICDRYAEADPRVQVIHKPNGGLHSSRNAGMERASGEWLTFLDGDDWLDPGMYEGMLSGLKEQGADLAVCRYKRVFQDRTVDRTTDMAAVMEGQEMLEKCLEEDERFLIQNAAWNKLYRRSLADGLAFPARLYEDMLYTARLLARTKRSIYLDHAWHNYVCDRSGSIMNMGINPRTFSDLIPNLYDRGAYLRSIGREDLALLQDYFMYKKMLLFYTGVARSRDPQKAEHEAYLRERLTEGKERYPAVFGIRQANPNEYRKMKLFLASPRLYLAAMRLNDSVLIPIKLRLAKKRRGQGAKW